VDARVHHDLVQVRARFVPFADVFARFARREQCQKLRQLGVDPGHLIRV
jgi:hypothetical protein